MIKISKDNILIWSRVLPIGFLIAQGIFIALVIGINWWPFYLFYTCFVLYSFIYRKFGRLFLLNDVYLNSQNGDHIRITFIAVNGTRTECDAKDIIKQRTVTGLTELTILKSGKEIKKYCAISSKENLKYLGGINKAF